MNKSNLIVASNVNKSVEVSDTQLKILCDINLQILTHEALIITGASGSGKTSLLSILAGLDTADSGSVRLLGKELSQSSEEERTKIRKNNVGFIFQNFQLIQGATAVENIQLPLELLKANNPKQNALKYLSQVGLESKANTQVGLLSGGEQQRVAIARAFAVEPKILFADEPTGNLDTKNAKQIADLMFEMRENQGTTLVLVTHETWLAERGDRIISMDSGRIIN